MRVINPYEGIDFSTAKRVNSVSHEHILTDVQFKRAYDRGIRHFALVHYGPAVPRYPFSNFYYRSEGVAWPYLDFVDATHEDQSLNNYNLEDKNYINNGYASFVDKDGNTVYTDDVPQVPNNEHPQFTTEIGVTTGFLQHFNVLGNLFPEAGVGVGTPAEARVGHPIYDFNDMTTIFLSSEHQEWNGKILGTVNHCDNPDRVIAYMNRQPNIFKAMEAYNNGYDSTINQQFSDAYDRVLSSGKRLWLTSVVDWQGNYGDRQEDRYDRGCNVLYVPDNYDSLPANSFLTGTDGKSYINIHPSTYTKAECGLDSYIAGTYYGSGFGNYKITELSVNGKSITFSCDGSPSSIQAITNKGIVNGSGNSITLDIKQGMIYARFVAKYNNDEQKDFIYTQPLWIEDNNTSIQKRMLIL